MIRSAPQSVCPTTRRMSRVLTGGFKVLNVIFKVSLVSKIRPRNFASLTTCIGVFPRRMLGSGEKNILLMEMNLGGGELEAILRHPLLNTVYTQLYNFPLCLTSFHSHKAKLSTNKEQSVPFKTALTMLLILMLKRTRDRMLPCRTPISCLCSSERVEPTLTLKERSNRKL